MQPALGALGHTWTAMRAMEFISLITIIGLTANFIGEMVNADYAAPSALIGTLVVACISTLYIAISYILYWDGMLPLLLSTGADIVLLVACIVVACTVGKPVSYLSCPKFPSDGNTANFINSLFHNVYHSRGNTFAWVDPDKASCYQIKSIWGLSIALCVLFAFSAITSGCLWKRTKGASRPAPKDIEGPHVMAQERSLGTMAMAKRLDSDSSDAESASQPWCPPPPTAPVRVKRKEVPQPLQHLPPLPPVPVSPGRMNHSGSKSPLERVWSKRKTLLERVEGWWDLDLLEKRQTLFGGKRVQG
ncbi:membrane-associating domain-containing protein [Fusarium phyllophilum]|uniref:Membrane-associating domain-containing protein n=2 Tax=Fusarium fujikuroi species complex TaxID=171627 RepID=A0A8H5ICV8_9HYPO|nr:membrane-associating domain-containing protein [Fusarium phyllophilum]